MVLLQDHLGHIQQKQRQVTFFSPGAHGRGDVERIGTRMAAQSLVQHMPFGKSCFCPWAAAVWTRAEREGAMTDSDSSTFWLCPAYSAEET